MVTRGGHSQTRRRPQARQCRVDFIYTSRKHGKKESQSFSHYGSFDHHAMQSLNNYRLVFIDLPNGTLSNLGLIIYRWKDLEKYLSKGISHAPKHLIFSRKMKYEIL